MPSASQLYSTGRWLNAADLVNNPNLGLNKRVTAIVFDCSPEMVGQGGDQKTQLMLTLISRNGQAWPKTLLLNKGNMMQLVAAYGDDYTQWKGKAIEIWAENVSFQNRIMPGIRLTASANGTGNGALPAPPAQAQAAAPASSSPSATAVTGMPPFVSASNLPKGAPIEDDEIPF